MKAIFAVALLEIAILCASTLAQENNTARYWIEKARGAFTERLFCRCI